MKEDIQYILRGISIEQFATPFEPSSDDIIVNVNIPIRTNYLEHTLAVGANVQFLEDDKPFIVAEVFCHYMIEPNCWDLLSESDSKDVVLPKGFINNLAGIAVGAARGVLCAKMEKTPFAKFFLPLIMIDPKQGNDLIISRSDNTIVD